MHVNVDVAVGSENLCILAMSIMHTGAVEHFRANWTETRIIVGILMALTIRGRQYIVAMNPSA